jgi:Domain of unknown function (DUF4347)
MGKLVAIVDYDNTKDLQGLAGPAWFDGLAGWSHVGSFGGLLGDVIRFKNLGELINKSIETAQSSSVISSYSIVCHGEEKGLWFNDYTLTQELLIQNNGLLNRLQQVLDAEGRLNLKACLVGGNQEFMRYLARTVGVPVYAGNGLEQMIYPYNNGEYYCCSPAGNIRKVSWREFYDR